MKKDSATYTPSGPSGGTVSRIIERNGRTLILFSDSSPKVSALSAYEQSMLTPVCLVADVDTELIDEEASAPPNPNSKRIGTRNRSIERIGRRKRRIFFVAPEDVERDDAWLSEPGWYIDTVRPPAAWISNDPFGPFATLEDLRKDSECAYRSEEE